MLQRVCMSFHTRIHSVQLFFASVTFHFEKLGVIEVLLHSTSISLLAMVKHTLRRVSWPCGATKCIDVSEHTQGGGEGTSSTDGLRRPTPERGSIDEV